MKKIFNLLIFLLIGILCVIALFLVTARVVGYTPYVIESDSMAPTYAVNDIVYVKNVEFDQIKKDDVITFVNSNNNIVTHRVNEIDTKEKCIYTKGDSNEFADIMPVYEENIIGIVKFSIPKLGVISIQFREE